MTRPLCSVVFSTYQRAPLLARSLHCYMMQDFPKEEFELVVIDDDSHDNTREIVEEYARETGVRTTYLVPMPKTVGWRDVAATINHGIRVSTGKHVLLTHPEVLVSRRSVRACVDVLEAFERQKAERPAAPIGLYACCKPYYLTRRDQDRIDSCPWREEGAVAVRKIPGFYDSLMHAGGHPDYAPWVIDAVGTPGYEKCPSGADGRNWASWVFGGMSRRAWKELGGMIETQRWGSVDLVFDHRRRLLGIPTHTCTADDTFAVHMNHDTEGNVMTPRDINAAHAEAGSLGLTPDKCVYPFVSNLE